MSPGRAEAQAEDARSALTRRSARSYLRPDIAASHRARPSFTAANPPQFRAAFRQPPRPCPPNQPASTHPHLFQESQKATEALPVKKKIRTGPGPQFGRCNNAIAVTETTPASQPLRVRCASRV